MIKKDRPGVLLIATMDTKADESLYIEKCLQAEGINVFIMDPGILGRPNYKISITRGRIARAAGKTLKEVQAMHNEGEAMKVMLPGAVKIALGLYKEGKIKGIISLGGSMGTFMGTGIMRSFPIGVPKVMISTMASGNTRNFVGTSDIMMIPSVCDISGLNRVTKNILHNGALAIAGMINGHAIKKANEKPIVAISTLGGTEPCAKVIRSALEEDGYEVMIFHTNGSGGRGMEELLSQLDIKAVVDLSLTEINGHLFGGDFDAGPDRGKTALEMGIPSVIVPGNVDFLVTGPLAEAKKRFPGRNLHVHNEAITAVQMNKKEHEIIGQTLADIWNKADGPMAVFVPLEGFSAYNSKGGCFYETKNPQNFSEFLKKVVNKNVSLNALQNHINDFEFAEALIGGLRKILS